MIAEQQAKEHLSREQIINNIYHHSSSIIMSSGLMASAHMRMKQKREKHANMTSPSSAAKSVSSPSSTIASPTNNNNMMTSPTNAGAAASSVASPRNSNSDNNTPVAAAGPVSPGRMGSGGGGKGGSMPYDYRQPQQQQQQSQYSPLFKGNNNGNNNGGGSGGRYQPTPPSPSYPTPLDSSPNRPMRKEEPFDSAIQHRGNYTHHLSPRSPQHGRPNRPRRGYDSYTESSKEEQEQFNRQYYQQLASQNNAPPPPPPPPPGMPPQQQQEQQQVAFDPFRPSPVTIPNGTTNTNDRMSPYFQDTQFQQAMMRQEQQQQQQQQQQNQQQVGLMQDESGGSMMHGDYEYDTTEDEEAKDVVSPMMLRTTGVGGVDEEETISSEVALNGDPSGKKDKKKKKTKTKKKSSVGDARYLIHNVGSADAMEKPPSASDPRYGIHLTGSNDDDDDDDEDDDEVYEDDQSKESSSINYRDIAAHAGRYVTRQEPQQSSSPKSNSKNTNPFDDNSSFDSKGGYLPKRIGNANSWDGGEGGGGGEGSKNDGANEGDNNNNVPVWNEDKKQRNMWEDDNSNTIQKFTRNSKSWDQENIDSFDANLWAGSSNGSFLPSGNTKDNNANDQTLAEWDKAEAEFQKKAQQEVTPTKDKEVDSVMNKSYPWKGQQPQEQPTTYNGPSMEGGRVSDSEGSESDADSLFKFDKQKAAVANNDVFDKISHGLEQADNARNGVAVGNESDGSYDQSSAYPGKSGENRGPTSPPRSVAFAGEAENKVHTYLVPQDQNSASDSGTYETRDDEEDDETDGDTLEENTLEDGDTIDNYTLDDATYGESTLGGGTIETGYTGHNTEGDIDIMDHVDKAVAVIGSALGSFFLTKDQAPNSSTSIENDETIQNSTMGGSMEEEANAKGAGKSEYDWMGYMEKFLFPQDGEDGETRDGSTLQESTMRSASTSASATNSGEEGEDGDDYLLQQALASAKAIHHIHGIQFDELQDINVLTDIKFVVVSVPLPLGLLFQEHEIGAWVSRTVPDGNGARKGIQPGDQLAAINGKSSVHATIDEVASIISSTPKNEAVELTFLRYVGPLRPVPGAIIQEGFEVTDKNVSLNKGKPKKGIFGLSKKTKANMTPASPVRPSGKASLEFTPNQKRSAKNLNTSTQQQQSATKSKSKQTTQVKSPTSEKGKSPFKKIFGGKKKS